MAAFGAASTTDEVLAGRSLRGKRWLVTGVSAGIGVETARGLVAHGANVVGAVRDLAKADRATAEVRAAATANGGSFELQALDLASLSNARAASDAVRQRIDSLDGIIANAGVMACPQGATADGFETQFGTNHLGHFVFVNRLVPLLGAGGRIVMLSSAGHRFADVDLDDPNFARTAYDPFVAYGRSKTANILHAVELDRRLASKGIRACAVHPGVIQTELGRHMTPELLARIVPADGSGPPLPWKTIPQGAATSLWSAITADAAHIGGTFCEDCHVAEITEDLGQRGGVRRYAIDTQRAAALWELSERLVGERFDF